MPCEHPLWPAQPFAEDETMQRPLNIIDLAITAAVSQDAAEVARRLDKAADLVEDFAADAALTALEELVALAATPGAVAPTAAPLEGTRRLAAAPSQPPETPHPENGTAAYME